MSRLLILLLFSFINLLTIDACTIVAVSGKSTVDGRPLLLKNRDSKNGDVKIKIGKGQYAYLCQCNVPNGSALSGYNEMGFSIINSHSYNMPNSDYEWNAYIMQMALEQCATVDEFENLLSSLVKPISVCSNYGVMDAKGHVALFEVSSYHYARYNADDTDCGFLIRTNYSMSQDTTGVNQKTPSSLPRYLITSEYLEETITSHGKLAKEDLIKLSRCLVNSDGVDLLDDAPYDENSSTLVDFRNYVPRFKTTSAMIIQGVLPNELPNLTVAWTMVGPPMTSVTIPYILTSKKILPQKAKMGNDGFSWFSHKGLQLKDSCFIDDNTLELATLYNLCGTGILQKVCSIEEEILSRGNKLVNDLRNGMASDYDIDRCCSWVDYYVDDKYEQYYLLDSNMTTSITNMDIEYHKAEYYDLAGRRIRHVRDNAKIKTDGRAVIVM